MQINELTPSDIKSSLKKKKLKVPFKGHTKLDTSDAGLWANFKRWDAFLRKNGWRKLGAGSFAAVFGKTGLNYVIKVPFYRDRPWMRYAQYCVEHRGNPHVMKVSFLKEETSNHFFIAAIERLKKFPVINGWDMSKVVANYTDNMKFYSNEEMIETVTNYANAQSDKKMANWLLKVLVPQLPKLTETVKDLGALGNLDLHEFNIMMRGNKVVIIDPWFDWSEKKPRSFVNSMYS
jgi:hypothetical protein